MKLPTSTSFVMAATASLALQSSALAVPDSPLVGRASPHSARSAADAQFPGSAPELGSPSPAPSRSIMMEDITLPELASAGSIDELVGVVGGTLSGLGIRADKDADVSVLAAQSNDLFIGKRQAAVPMAPPGAPASAGSETNGPNQAMNSVQPQTKPSPQASNVNSKLPQKREPQLPAAPVPYPQIPSAAGGFANGAPVPGSIPGFPGQVSGGTPASGAIGNVAGSGQYLPNPEGVVGGVASGIPVVGGVVGGAVNQLPNVQGVAGQTLGNTPFRGVAGNLIPGSMQGRVEGANRQPGMGAQGVVSNGAAPFGLQGQAGPPDAADEGAGNGSASPSSITATPSSSPVCTGQTNQASQSTTDSSSAGATPVMDIEFAPSVPAPVPNAPTSGLPVPDGAPVPSLPIQPPSSLPVSRPASAPTSAPVSAPAPPVAPRSIAQVFRDAGEPDHVSPSAPVKPPVSAPSSAPVKPPVSAPSNAPVSAPVHPSASASAPVPAPTQNAPKPPMFMRAKRALMGREPQMPAPLSNDPALPSGFPAPSLPIPGDVPPLLQSGMPTAVPATKDAIDAHSSLSHPVSNTGTFTSWTSSDYSPASTASTKDKMTPSKSTWGRRRFFRFNRD